MEELCGNNFVFLRRNIVTPPLHENHTFCEILCTIVGCNYFIFFRVGKSGVSIVGRHSLQQLLSDVEQKKIDIQAVLFYDVSRFGRFQNSDEAAYYSFLFERNGVDLIYCSEPIPTKDFPLESSG